MKTYFLTVFDQTGERLLNESFEASDNEEAKKIGQTRLGEEGYSEYTHRCVSPNAKLVLFHR
ncbi:YhzD-like protein [Lentibacillus persicus]|uniref:YhzD-like protein n=1 Tax=Lentibacillus persicus TaxID=640948 RepID=A0A1I1RYE5_9BACI|nr:YhzD family protein [Lentibacillus persicus]SFD36553.1 YhzD-like protein [Lentibacillus persicus]